MPMICWVKLKKKKFKNWWSFVTGYLDGWFGDDTRMMAYTKDNHKTVKFGSLDFTTVRAVVYNQWNGLSLWLKVPPGIHSPSKNGKISSKNNPLTCSTALVHSSSNT